MFLRIFLSTVGGFLVACLFISVHIFISVEDFFEPFILVSCLLGVYVGVMWGLWHKGVFDKK